MGKDTRFKPGNLPHNCGKPFHAGGRSVETQYQPGNRSGAAIALYRQIGAERVTRDGYLQRKVTD